jgi:DNA-binding transcriptional ArsR family regulator
MDEKKLRETVQLRLQPATVPLHNPLQVMRRDIFQALADPTRRAIIALIALQAMTPNALAEHFHTSRQAVSKHLRILTECELVTPEQKGREIYYRLEIEKMKEIDEWLEQYRKIWETRYSQLDDLLAAIKKEKEEK